MNRTGLVIALAVATVVGLVFGIWPELDLALAAPFYDPARGGYWRAFDPGYGYLRDGAVWLITLIALPAFVAPVVKLIRPHAPMLVPGRAAILMVLTLALGPGLVTNLIFKENWHRPRPIDVAEFKGDEHFRPWWDPRGDCPKNCSFVGGDASGAFWTLAPAAVVPVQWRALAYGAALAFGAGVSVLRMAAGAHFFSDVAFAGVFTFLVIWLVHGSLYRWPRTRITDAAVEHAIARLRGNKGV
ncbi:MAG TPA: phosphatase PAP2 family protein [Xanthobacteraceae bacterium]|nr:phosphatase PAP2 family protein [Xanthobacteraceae bacterium]